MRTYVGAIALVVTAFAARGDQGGADDFPRVRPRADSATSDKLDAMEGKAPPALDSGVWINSDPRSWKELRGNVVLLDFWGVWCKPCVKAVPKLNELQDELAGQGFVVIGIHSDDGKGRVEDFVHRHSIQYPIVVDDGDRLGSTFNVVAYPGYFLIDRNGVLRVAHLNGAELEFAVPKLLEEDENDKVQTEEVES